MSISTILLYTPDVHSITGKAKQQRIRKALSGKMTWPDVFTALYGRKYADQKELIRKNQSARIVLDDQNMTVNPSIMKLRKRIEKLAAKHRTKEASKTVLNDERDYLIRFYAELSADDAITKAQILKLGPLYDPFITFATIKNMKQFSLHILTDEQSSIKTVSKLLTADLIDGYTRTESAGRSSVLSSTDYSGINYATLVKTNASFLRNEAPPRTSTIQNMRVNRKYPSSLKINPYEHKSTFLQSLKLSVSLGMRPYGSVSLSALAGEQDLYFESIINSIYGKGPVHRLIKSNTLYPSIPVLYDRYKNNIKSWRVSALAKLLSAGQMSLFKQINNSVSRLYEITADRSPFGVPLPYDMLNNGRYFYIPGGVPSFVPGNFIGSAGTKDRSCHFIPMLTTRFKQDHDGLYIFSLGSDQMSPLQMFFGFFSTNGTKRTWLNMVSHLILPERRRPEKRIASLNLPETIALKRQLIRNTSKFIARETGSFSNVKPVFMNGIKVKLNFPTFISHGKLKPGVLTTMQLKFVDRNVQSIRASVGSLFPVEIVPNHNLRTDNRFINTNNIEQRNYLFSKRATVEAPFDTISERNKSRIFCEYEVYEEKRGRLLN